MTSLPGCAERCPGCAHRDLPADESRARKGEWLAHALAPWATRLEPVRGDDAVEAAVSRGDGYREKTSLRAHWRDGAWRFGLRRRRPGASGTRPEYELVEIPGCPVHSRRVRAALDFLSARLPDPADGFPLEFVVITGRLATLVLKARPETATPGFVARLAERLAGAEAHGLVGVWLNCNPSAGERVLAHRGWTLLQGSPRAALPFVATEGRAWSHGPSSFQQLLPGLYAGALGEAQGFLRPGAGDSVLDLCSGLGLSLARWRAAGARAVGVELGGEAVECALAALGDEAFVLRGRVSERIPQLNGWREEERARGGSLLAFVNPPRLGLEPEVTRWLADRARPARIAYLSCSAGTLARDLDLLAAKGYAVERIIPYDFFPRTHHVETLALLSLSGPA